jgi:CubicO group peptidase (beta-lactamase class C family)
MIQGGSQSMTRLRVLVAASLCAAVVLVQPGSAQTTLSYGLFERYIDALRVQVAIPGLSAAILRDGRLDWERGLGRQDLEGAIAALPDTPYPVAGLTQVVAITHLLGCAERQRINSFSDPIRLWVPAFPVAEANLRHVAAHASDGAPVGQFRFDTGRYAALTTVAESCESESFPAIIAREILDRLGMASSVPGTDLGQSGSPAQGLFTADRLARYGDLLQRTAVPYRINSSGQPVRSDFPIVGLSASTGLITTVRDLARFLLAMDAGVLLHPESVKLISTPADFGAGPLPTAFGWFAQRVDGEDLVWQFGHHPGAYSSLVVRVPARRLTLILLANSGGLASGAQLERGDISTSPFVRIFLKLFV